MRAIDADALEKVKFHPLPYTHITPNDVDAESYKRGWNDAIDAIVSETPTIEPEPHWIPCSERLPDEKDVGILKMLGTEKRSEYVLATVEVKGERMTVTACTYDGKWDWNMKYAFPDYKIIAWMPLPEPYREEGNS